jgi:glycosyltransferase involved in cell wall biosynthesis
VPSPALLCVCNYPSNTGYAWDFIESLYAAMASRLAAEGIRTFVAYPIIDAPPRTLHGSPAVPVVLDARLADAGSLEATRRFVRQENVQVLYLTDRPAWLLNYARVRSAGLRSILVHDHTSGARSAPQGPRRWLKAAIARTPRIVADKVIAVSEYVARRQIDTGMMPPDRVVRVWNGIPVPPAQPDAGAAIRAALGLAPARPIIACACRAAAEKGVPTLLKAFDLLRQRPAPGAAPILVYMGDGPDFENIKRTREALASRGDIVLTGYRRDAGALIAGADVCVMPSLWQDALPLAVMQPMALGLPVIASAVGGIPEMIEDGKSGLLVPAGDERALASALQRVLDDPAFASELGRAARARIAAMFTPDAQIDALTNLVWTAMQGRRPRITR